MRFRYACLRFICFILIFLVLTLGLELTNPQFAKANRAENFNPTKFTQIVNLSNADGEVELLQFTSAGHALGFDQKGVYVATGDHMLREIFVGTDGVIPAADQGGDGDGQALPLGMVRYTNLWDGISLIYDSTPGSVLRSTYLIEPGADPNQIRLRYNVPFSIDKSGNLVFAFETGQMTASAPIAWQEIDGVRIPVDVSFQASKVSPLFGASDVSFVLDAYSQDHALIIDPSFAWNTFMGSTSEDSGEAIALDASGNVYVAGHSDAGWGSPRNGHAGGSDAFVAKLNSSGVRVWHTFMGSASADFAYGVAVDGSGNVYVAGDSYGSWGSPIIGFAGGGTDAFAAKLNNNGDRLWNTFIGGTSGDDGHAIAVDGGGTIYVTGTSTANWGNPVNAFVGSGGRPDAFAVKLNTNGGRIWNTFLGGANVDEGFGIAVDGSLNVYVTGYSKATWGSPVTGYGGGYHDAFAAKLNSSGGRVWHTFLGGASTDQGYDIAVDPSGNVYVAGISYDSWGSPRNNHAGDRDAFAAKLNSSGGRVWNTFMGNSVDDDGNAVAVDAAGNVYIAGTSPHYTWGSPVNSHTGNDEAFAAKLNSNGDRLWNTFMGGVWNTSGWYDHGNGIAVDSIGNVYVTGESSLSWGSPVNAHNSGTEFDAFAVKIDYDPEIDLQRPANTSIATGSTDSQGLKKSLEQVTLTYTVKNTGVVPLSVTNIAASSLSSVTVGTISQTNFTVAANGGSTTFDVPYTPAAADGNFSFDLTLTNDDPDESTYTITISGDRDGTAPAVTAIDRADTDPTTASSVDFTVTFSEAVSDIEKNDFALATTGTVNGTINSVSASSGTSVTVNVNGISGNGTLGLNFDYDALDSVVDGAGNFANADFTGQTYTYVRMLASKDGSNNLVVDESGTGTDNDLTISFDGTDYTITISAGTLGISGVAGATGNGTSTLTIPSAQIGGAKIIFNAGDGDDSLTLDFEDNSNPFNKQVIFNGQGQTSGDELNLTSTGSFSSAGFDFELIETY
ncbi:MAG: SBBP repeat-containing protein [Anaerolineales bacterium]|nr:SBBP repeat-containing protein [Chloroflexota bacterium]MBL6981816.1 SBBP repeat-containing protein [Anaerolineales bacterium]